MEPNNDKMTTKQLAGVAGVDIRTIQRAAAELFGNQKNGKRRFFTYEESIKIIEKVRKKNLVSLERQNVVPERQIVVLELSQSQLEFIESMIFKVIDKITNVLLNNKIMNQTNSSLPSDTNNPKITKKQLYYEIEQYCNEKMIESRSIFTELYKILERKTGVNLYKEKGKNESVLSVADRLGYIEQLHDIFTSEFVNREELLKSIFVDRYFESKGGTNE